MLDRDHIQNDNYTDIRCCCRASLIYSYQIVTRFITHCDEETGVITHEHPAFNGFDTTQVDAMIEKVGGNDADAALRLQAVIKLLESAKTSAKVIEVCVFCFVHMSFYR